MKVIAADDVRAWFAASGNLAEFDQSIGRHAPDDEYVESVLGMPLHLRFVVDRLSRKSDEGVAPDALDSIPFYSLCKGLFLPLSGLAPQRVAQIFGLEGQPAPDAAAREKLISEFLAKPVGLDMVAKLGAILGDPFLGRKSTFRRDSLLRLLMTIRMMKRTEMLDRLTVVGDVAVLFAESRPVSRVDPPLTAAEVLLTLHYLPEVGKLKQFDLLRSLLERMGRLEAYFLAKLLLRKTGFGFDYQAPLLAQVVGKHFGVEAERVSHAVALTDLFHVVRVLSDEGPQGLRKIHLQPLAAVKPALAGGTTDEIDRFPVWVERKYDGIRLMLHKSTDARGAVLCGAYTRNRHDWLELVPGLASVIRMLPARNVILDGELYGTVFDVDGPKPATVYEVYSWLQGEGGKPVSPKFAAFDLIYLEGHDLTERPLAQRRQMLAGIVGPLGAIPMAVPISLSEGQSAEGKDDLNRLYHHFRAQGYEGIIAKDPAGKYCLAGRDLSWRKRKPEITLDLALLGAVLAVTTKETAGAFGSYVIGARKPDGSFEDVGDVAGVDKERDRAIQAEILRDGLMTGKRIERPSASGVRPGFELRPSMVATVKFEGITLDQTTGRLSLRDPKLVMIRSDKNASEADTTGDIERLHMRQRMG